MLERLGVMRRLRATHDRRPLRFAWRVLGHEVAGDFTPVGGYDRGTCVRRIVLDAALVDAAAAAGVELRTGVGGHGLLGAGTAEDPVRGVVLDDGERRSRRGGSSERTAGSRPSPGDWASPTTGARRGELAMLLRLLARAARVGLVPDRRPRASALMSVPCEDGIHLLAVSGPPEITRGSAEARERRTATALRHFPAVLNPRLLDHATQVSPLVAVPETMMRGYRATAAGPGWALVGDAGLYTHPVTGQGIGDAVHQGWYVGRRSPTGGDLSGYEEWRDGRAAEHYELVVRRWPASGPRRRGHYSGLAADPVAEPGVPGHLHEAERPARGLDTERVLARWNTAWAYDEARRRVVGQVLDAAGDHVLEQRVPSCPEWTVRDLLAHLAGVAEDAVDRRVLRRRRCTPGATPPPPRRGRAGRRATSRGRASRAVELVRRAPGGARRAGWWPMLRHGDPARRRVPGLVASSAPLGDMAVHIARPQRGARRRSRTTRSPLTRFGFASVPRLAAPAARSRRACPRCGSATAAKEWTVGEGPPAGCGHRDRVTSCSG